MSLYNTDGQITTTVVDGSTQTGLYSVDGNWNIVINDGTTIKGRYHPCGAFNAVVTTDQFAGSTAPNGSMYVTLNSSGGYSPTPLGGSSLRTLALTNGSAVTNAKVSDAVAWILNRTPGSSLSLTDASGKLSLSGERLAVGSTMSAGTLNFSITETKGGASKVTNLSLVVTAGITGTAFDTAQLGSAVLNETFSSAPDIWTPSHTGGAYATFYNFGADGTPAGRYANVGSRTLGPSNGAANNEAEVYSDLGFNGVDPFSIHAGGGLRITQQRTPAAILAAMSNLPVTSGMLRYLTSTFTNGYFEVRGRADIAQGLWPAFGWLIEATPSNGSEIDMAEVFGLTAAVYQSIHGPLSAADGTVLTPNTSDAVHTYGVLLKSDTISFYIDRIQCGPVRARPTFSGVLSYVLNYAAGWFNPTPPGVLDTAILPKSMDVDYWRAYAISGSAPTLPIDYTPAGAFGANLKSNLDVLDSSLITKDGSNNVTVMKDAVTGSDFPQYFKQGSGTAIYRASGRNSLPDIAFTDGYLEKGDSLLVPADGTAFTIAFVGASMASQIDNFDSAALQLGDGFGQTIRLETWSGQPALTSSLGRKSSAGGASTLFNTDRIIIVSQAAGANPPISLWIDGRAVETFTTSGTMDTNDTFFRLAYSWRGWFQQMLLLDIALDQTKADKLSGHLAWNWGGVSRLPGGHPYKSAPPTL